MRIACRISRHLVAMGLVVAASACGSADQASPPASSASATASVRIEEGQSSVDPVPTTEEPRPVISIPGTFRTRSVLSLDDVTSAQRQRITDAMWDFRSGTFTFDSTDVAANLFPLVGHYSVNGTTVSFQASNSFSAGTATTMSASVEGALDLLTGNVDFTLESNAFGAAVVNGQPQGGGVSSLVRGVVQVKRGTKIPPHHSGPEPGSYAVTVQGSVNGVSFSRSATLHVARSAGGNPIDVCLISGFPAGLPEVGAIRFVSNTVCFPGASNNFDMGSVTVSGSNVTVKADPMMEPTGMSQFTSSNSIMACLYSVRSGTMKVQIANGGASGTIDVGSSSCGGGRYQAEFG